MPFVLIGSLHGKFISVQIVIHIASCSTLNRCLCKLVHPYFNVMKYIYNILPPSEHIFASSNQLLKKGKAHMVSKIA